MPISPVLRLSFLSLLSFALLGCTTKSPAQNYLRTGLSSQIRILDNGSSFKGRKLPPGWVLMGLSEKTAFNNNQIPLIRYTHAGSFGGLHIQNAAQDFILARYSKARMLAIPYLMWYWRVSEHQGQHHPVRLLVGFYGGAPQSPPLPPEHFVWKGNQLPPFDRLLAIGFDDMALKRGNIYDMGRVKYYAQRGGIEQTNIWYQEAVDLSLLYQEAWPNDNRGKVYTTFIGFGAVSSAQGGGISFSNIRLTR